MKLTAFLILSACMMANANGYTQGISYKAKQESLEKVLAAIKKQTGYSFFYNNADIKLAKPVTIELKEADLQTALKKIFESQPLDFSIEGKTIFVNKKPTNPNGEATIVNEPPPPIDITGKVTDENGNPLAGASVKVKNSSKGTTTNNDGVFILKGVDDNAVLEVSYVGFESISIPVSNRTAIVTALKQKPENLNEVVINKGYYTEKQKYTLGNSVHIGKEAFEQSPVQNPLLVIQGRATGIEVTQLTGLPGGGVSTRIQGVNSFSSALEPLIVIDGVPFPAQFVGIDPSVSSERIIQGGSPLNYINPDDIESVDILKDADATAIYGSRAANGAILITTKKGKAGRTKLSINLQQGWGKVGHEVDMMNTREYLDMRYEALRNDGIAISTLTPGFSTYDIKLWDTTRYTNWQKTLIGGTAQYSNFNASLSGGNSAVQYLIGGTYNRQTTVFPGDFDDKTGTLHFNINGSSPNQRLRLQLTGGYSYDQNQLPGIDLTRQAVLTEPVAPALYNQDGSVNWAPNVSGSSSWTNPLAYTRGTSFIGTTKNLVSNAQLSYRILPGLDLRSSFGYSNTQSELYTANRIESFAPEQRPNSQRSATFGNRNMSSWIIEPQLQYSCKLGNGKIDGLLATSIQKNSYNYLAIDASGFSTDLLMKTLRASTSTNIRQSLSGITRFNAIFGRLGYNWDDKYFINLTARRDGSNKFGVKNRFHNFGSLGLGWIFSNEKWLNQSLPFVSFGKLRASYGTTGNDGIPEFGYLSIYNINNPTILYQNSIGLNAFNIPNPYLQWEEARKWQIGLDLGFVKDRTVIGATYSRNRSSNQLAGYALPAITGFVSMNKNIEATIENTSWEFTLNTVNVKGKKFNWTTNVNFTLPQNKLIRYPGLSKSTSAGSLIIGEPIGMVQLVRYSGVNWANGAYSVLNKNGDPITVSPTEADKSVFLSTFTKYYGGMANNFRYNGFQLDFLFQFVRKIGARDMYYYNGNTTPGRFVGGSNQPVSVLNRWQKPGDNAAIGRFTTTTAVSSIFTQSDAWYSNEASFIRLKNVSLSWQLPVEWIKRARLQTVRLYANAQNLLTFTRYTGLDPESMSITTLPPLRMITMGVQVEF